MLHTPLRRINNFNSFVPLIFSLFRNFEPSGGKSSAENGVVDGTQPPSAPEMVQVQSIISSDNINGMYSPTDSLHVSSEELSSSQTFSFNALEAISETDEPVSGNATPVMPRHQEVITAEKKLPVDDGEVHHVVTDEDLNGQLGSPTVEVSVVAPDDADDLLDPVEAEREAEERSRLLPLTVSEYSASVRSLHDKDVDDLMLRAVHLLESSSGSETSIREIDEALSTAYTLHLQQNSPQLARHTPQSSPQLPRQNAQEVRQPSPQVTRAEPVDLPPDPTPRHEKATSPVEQKSGNFVTATLINEKGVGLGVIDGKVSDAPFVSLENEYSCASADFTVVFSHKYPTFSCPVDIAQFLSSRIVFGKSGHTVDRVLDWWNCQFHA